MPTAEESQPLVPVALQARGAQWRFVPHDPSRRAFQEAGTAATPYTPACACESRRTQQSRECARSPAA
eukprot:3868646-Prymnesium_polylepis.1